MSAPYTSGTIARILRMLTAEQLAATSPQQFQLWPARVVVPTATVAEMIRNERSNRRLGR